MLRKMSIGLRLGLGFGLLVFMLAIMASVGLYEMAQIDGRLVDITQVNVPAKDLAAEMRILIDGRAIAARDLVLAKDEAKRQDAIERQMSHKERNGVRAAYVHKAEHLEARMEMMQWWSDYLDVSREGYVAPYIYARRHKAA